MNQESNAAKFIEQDKELGLSPDVTMEILNKYATYGANTGIGNLGGNKLVEALNEEYRKRIDEPLNEEPKEAFIGGLGEFLTNLGSGASDFLKNIFTNVPTELSGEAAKESLAALDAAAVPGVEPTASASVTEVIEAVNSPVTIHPTDNPLLPQATRLERFEKYLEENPLVAKQLMASGQDLGKILGSALVDDDEDRKAPIRAPRPRFQPGRIRPQAIGMREGGGKSVMNRKMFTPEGGEVDGPGGPTEDLVPAWLSDQEYVVSFDGVKRMGGGDFEKGIAALDKINFGRS